MLLWEVIEGDHAVPVPLKGHTGCFVGVVAAPSSKLRPEPLSLCPSLGVGDGTQHELGLVLLSLWKPVQYV